MNEELMFSSKNMFWQTPPEVYRWLDKQYRFAFDPCPPNPTFDGLAVDWGKSNFVNPPYGREIGKWLDKAVTEQKKNRSSVFLIPARPDTQWWARTVAVRADRIIFITGRVKFVGATAGAPFPSAIVVFNPILFTALHRYEYIPIGEIMAGGAE